MGIGDGRRERTLHIEINAKRSKIPKPLRVSETRAGISKKRRAKKTVERPQKKTGSSVGEAEQHSLRPPPENGAGVREDLRAATVRKENQPARGVIDEQEKKGIFR